jgi:hypothetical protein
MHNTVLARFERRIKSEEFRFWIVRRGFVFVFLFSSRASSENWRPKSRRTASSRPIATSKPNRHGTKAGSKTAIVFEITESHPVWAIPH